MANLTETPTWEPAIYQLEEEDLVQGGPDGIDNVQGKQLANRTQYLKAEIENAQGDMEAHLAATDPHTQYATESYVNEGLGTRAPLASPALIGEPTAPTPDAADNSQKIATTAWLYSAMATVMSYFGFAISLGANGYIKFPSILGGWSIQYGVITVSGGAFSTVTFPIAFQSSVVSRVGNWASSTYSSAVKGGVFFGASATPLATMNVGITDASGTYSISWFALGH